MRHLSSRVGLIADSHGSAASLAKAVDALAGRNIREFIHLGDFFDSIYTKNTSEVLSILQKNRIRTVKGNNDYQVEKMIDSGILHNFGSQKDSCLAFLKQTPLLYVNGNACFSHSMPFDSIRSFYEPIDIGTTERAAEVFQNTSHHVLFCGHSHKPVFFRYSRGKVSREPIAACNRVGIHPGKRYIFIVGSAENGECGFYNTLECFYERIVFD